MARPLRIIVPGGWYHIVNRGNRREPIFRSDDDRRRFLGCLAEFPERFRIEVHAFVLMENHYHLVLRLGDANLSRAIQWLQLSYSVRFNWSHRLAGHVFQGRFKAMHIQHQDEVGEVARYLHLNPVRLAGLKLAKADQGRARGGSIPDPGAALVARRLRLLDAHPWSSWRVYAGREPVPSWLETSVVWRANGGRSRREWMAAVREYTEAPVRQGHVERPWDRLVGGIVLGELDYARRLLRRVKADPTEQTEARSLSRAKKVPWEVLVAMAEKERGVAWKDALERHGDWTRDALLYAAVRHGGWRLSEVYGNIPGLRYQAAAQGVKRIAARLARDAECRRLVDRLKTRLSKL
jgi:REP element-mobilizing transposase RayT